MKVITYIITFIILLMIDSRCKKHGLLYVEKKSLFNVKPLNSIEPYFFKRIKITLNIFEPKNKNGQPD
jgi:hypothetical protein